MSTQGKGYIGGQPNKITASGSTPPAGGGWLRPVIDVQGASLGDTIYIPITSIFDPRVLQDSDGSARYSQWTPGFDYYNNFIDYLYRRVFAERPGRQEPPYSVFQSIVDNLADISRMLGIYYTALTMKQSRDPEMFQRARILDLRDSFDDMQAILQHLPCPRFLAYLNAKYVRLMDVSSSNLYQNIGFIVPGDYAAFATLAQNVRSRRDALAWMRLLWPELGTLGDPGSQYNADVLQAFINCTPKVSIDSGYTSYCTVQNGTEEVERLQSAGILHSARFIGSSGAADRFTCTGFGAPGSGYGIHASLRVPDPVICRWNGANDAAINRLSANTNYAVSGSSVTYSSVLDEDLAANVGHEYNMSSDETTPAANHRGFNTDTGNAISSDFLTAENARYRVSAGFALGQLSFRLTANHMALLAAIVD